MPNTAARRTETDEQCICEIVPTIVAVPIYVGVVPLHCNYVGFQAETKSHGQPTVVAAVAETDEISENEMASGTINETAKRRAIVEQLTTDLGAKGWVQMASGPTWFGRRFRK